VNISKDCVVTFHYTITDADGEVLETSQGDDPTAYLHGAGNIMPALERELAGKQTGDSLAVTLAPADAYGERDETREQKVPVKHLRYKGKLRPGQVVALQTGHGQVPVTVKKVGLHSATVDTNHPLAGKVLQFELSVVDVREASPEERSHGHAHGPGGHHH
jgi:FKBP-type peptidyl-prolyl cis-trans isomerase SlyD